MEILQTLFLFKSSTFYPLCICTHHDAEQRQQASKQQAAASSSKQQASSAMAAAAAAAQSRCAPRRRINPTYRCPMHTCTAYLTHGPSPSCPASRAPKTEATAATAANLAED